MKERIDNYFRITERGSSIRTEALAGLTTFMSMAYILAVNPSILSAAGMDGGKVFTATALASAIATFIMAFAADYPIVLSSAMGLNAYFAYSVSIPLAQSGVEDPWKIALLAIFCEGIIFILLSFSNFREKLVNDVPTNLKLGITCGIGLFIAMIGLKNAGVIVADSGTLIGFGNIGTTEVALSLIGILIIGVLYSKGIRGALLFGMLITWGLGMIAQLIGWYHVDPEAGVYSLFPSFSGSFLPSAPYFCEFSAGWAAEHILDFCIIIFSFLFVDLFDTVGTLIGIAGKAGLLNEKGELPRVKQALLSDAVGTSVGAIFGTSTISSFVESSAGVSAGAKTGFSSLVAGGLFIVALLFSPIFTAIPSFATTPVLVFVGLLMMSQLKNMVFENGDIADIIGGYLAIIMMPFTGSIAYGIMFGMLSWVILKIATGKIKEIPAVIWIAAGMFVIKIITMI